MMQLYLTDLINPLSSLLCSNNLEVATSCATALNMIFSNLSVKREKEAWEIVKEAKIVIQIIRIMRKFPGGTLPIENFQELASLLYAILWRWPPSRYCVWNDTILMKVLEDSCKNSSVSTKVAVLKLYYALALCNKVAKELLENRETILPMMVYSMGGSEPLLVRIEGFRLAQHLAVMVMICFLSLIPLTDVHYWRNDSMELGLWKSCKWSDVFARRGLSIVSNYSLARRTSLHNCFWEKGIDEVLLDLLLENFDKQAPEHPLSPEEQMSIAQEGLDTNFLLALRPYIWEILGWLAVHSTQIFSLPMLISFDSLSFVEAICKGCQICENDDTSRSESSSRAVLVMMVSASTYIASKIQDVLDNVSAPGPRWLAAHILSYFGVYGFPNKHYKGFGKALVDKEHTYLQLFFANGESVSAHRIILIVRCPSLIPPEQFPRNANTTDNFSVIDIPERREDLARKLKTLAKSCNMQLLFLMLCRKIPKWGTPIPSSDLIDALGPVGFQSAYGSLSVPLLPSDTLTLRYILEDVQEACFRSLISCLESDRQLALEVIKLAASFSAWKLAEVAADYMPLLYHKLRDSGGLEELDELLFCLVRDASVRLSQERAGAEEIVRRQPIGLALAQESEYQD
ncbi:hypothetical protein CRYUN_Cryun26dG0121000 [Craigia yunnanensis]